MEFSKTLACLKAAGKKGNMGGGKYFRNLRTGNCGKMESIPELSHRKARRKRKRRRRTGRGRGRGI